MTMRALDGGTSRASAAKQFLVLGRAFLDQFFTSETVTSDVQLRQALIWVLAFLVTPPLFMLLHVAFLWDSLITFAPQKADAFLTQIAFLLVTHSMVSIGFVAAFVWHALAFDRRDALVLGPLPIASPIVLAAKLAAVTIFVLGTALVINLLTAVPLAVGTGSHLGLAGTARQSIAHLVATVGAATFVFATVIVLRAAATVAGSDWFVVRAGALLQFLFVAVLLCFVLVTPEVMQQPLDALTGSRAAAWLPNVWFLGVFEHLRGGSHVELERLARAGLQATAGLAIAAMLTTAWGFRRQAQRALAPSATMGLLEHAPLARTVARCCLPAQGRSRALSDFIVLTLVRSQAQRTPIAVNAAVGLAIVLATLYLRGGDIESLMRVRTVVLWIPLVLAYWLTIGVRASFFVPAELPAAWAFRVNHPDNGIAGSRAVHASMVGYIVPRVLMAVAPLGLAIGWPMAAAHGVFVAALTLLLVQIVACTVPPIPFTNPYRPGHARLKILWPVYAAGFYAFAYWPVRVELHLAHTPLSLLRLALLTCIVVAAAGTALEAGRRRWPTQPGWDDECEDEPLVALNITQLERSAPG